MNKKELIIELEKYNQGDIILTGMTSLLLQGVIKKAELFEYVKIKDNVDYTTCEGYFCESVLSIYEKVKNNKDKKSRDIIKAIDLYLCICDNKRYENVLYDEGLSFVAGVDEVGRGPLVGPVVAAAVILPKNLVIKGLTDSKKLSEKKREYYSDLIKKEAISYAICEVDNNVIDEVNIYEATKIAMKNAIYGLKVKPEHVLIDAMPLDIDIKTTSIIKGDLKSQTIAAASVLAKVYRDHLMYDLELKYPMYNYHSNKGYPTKEHVELIKKYGITPYYRKSFSPVKEISKIC